MPNTTIRIETIRPLLQTDNLHIPAYQRPYKWDTRNVIDLLTDIDGAMRQSAPYRIGTVILHDNKDTHTIDIVDGQQRLLTLLLVELYLRGADNISCHLLQTPFTNTTTQNNLRANYETIAKFFSIKDEAYKAAVSTALCNTLEAVVITVTEVSEAFQLFDSQNSRGKALDPHDLLKAYHLRAMKDYPHEMRHAVTKWEAVDPARIRALFGDCLFPIYSWTHKTKAHPFTNADIDRYKGVSQASPYTYARRANSAMPYFQLDEPFPAGNDFFEMVAHYLQLKEDIEREIDSNPAFHDISHWIKTNGGAGFSYCKQLFFCALTAYYDRFRNFDELAVKTLFTWAFMLRVDMRSLGFDSVNKYAIGESDRYTNNLPLLALIRHARKHTDISTLTIAVLPNNKNDRWDTLYRFLKNDCRSTEDTADE